MKTMIDKSTQDEPLVKMIDKGTQEETKIVTDVGTLITPKEKTIKMPFRRIKQSLTPIKQENSPIENRDGSPGACSCCSPESRKLKREYL
jgi:hypothetical protein